MSASFGPKLDARARQLRAVLAVAELALGLDGFWKDRIAQGVKSGSLTPGETAHIEKNESKLNKEVRQDRKANDGKLTPQEKAQVNRQQNKLSKQIYKDKHNAAV